MFEPAPSPWLVPFDGSFRRADALTRPPEPAPPKKKLKDELRANIKTLRGLQDRLYADDRWSILLVFQAMDAAGKDGTIRAVMSGINPAGCQVHSFKQPSAEELDHDFLWRTTRRMPERGRIGIFNRSYYEEVLVVRVHPSYLNAQRLPRPRNPEQLWRDRFEAIRAHEQHMANSGTVILKFWLNVSKTEQRRRFLRRIDDPSRNWKFSSGDIEERQHWEAYMTAYEDALRETSRPCAPWYAIPADNKAFMRVQVADVLRRTLEGLDLAYPKLHADQRQRLAACRGQLMAEDAPGSP